MRRIFLCSTLTVLVACGKPQSSNNSVDPQTATTDEVVLESYRLIDRDRSTEAVNLLESAVSVKPTDIKLRSTLASAYAHKADVKVQNLFPVFKKIIQSIKEAKEAKESLSSPELKKSDESNSVLDHRLEVVAELSRKVSAGVDVFLDLPVIDAQGVVLLNEAVSQFDGLESEMAKGDFSYRALLRGLLIRGEMTTGVKASLSRDEKGQCVLDLDKLQKSLLRSNRLAAGLMMDISAIDKSAAQSWIDRARKLSDTVEVLTISSSALIVVDEALIGTSRKQIFGPLLGDLVRCEP